MNTMTFCSTLAVAATLPATTSLAIDETSESHAEAHGAFVIQVDERDGETTHSERSMQVQMNDGEVSVIIDGKPIPSSRIRRDNGRIIVTGEDGKEHALFGVMMGQSPLGELSFFGPGQHIDYQPTVMLGIHLTRPGTALEHHLDLEPGTTTMISALHVGLPAHAAGLGEYDIITEIDGRTPADPATLVERLAEKEAGDVVALTVIQQGRSRRLNVVLDAYDSERMHEAEMIGQTPAATIELFGGEGGPGVWKMPFNWREFVVDPDRNTFLRRFDQEQWQDQLRQFGRSFEVEPEIDGRFEDLNSRIQDLQSMLDELVEKAQSLSRGADPE